MMFQPELGSAHYLGASGQTEHDLAVRNPVTS
jgi:hypothetical protein